MALTIGAQIADGTRVSVIAGFGVGVEKTPAQSVARVVGTRVVVIASDGTPYTLSCLAVVSNGAGVSVETLTLGEGIVGAAVLSVACICRARVFVVAGVFVHLTVTVVVRAVTRLLRRDSGVAVGESLFGAHAFSRAKPPVICLLAGGPKAQFHRFRSTGADARVGYALLKDDSVHRLRLLAGKPPRTFFTLARLASRSTEVFTRPVRYACSLNAGRTVAVPRGGARPAQRRVVGDADVDHVRAGAHHLVARPALGAFVLAGDGAHPFSHVVHAPAGEAVAVFGALVEEAPFAGFTLLHRKDIRTVG